MNATHLTRTVGGHGHLDNRERRSIRGDDGVGLDDAIEFTEERQFHIEVFDNRFEYKIAIGKVGKVGSCGDACGDGIGIGLFAAALLDLAGE